MSRRGRDTIIMLATGKRLKSERWYCRVYRDAEGKERKLEIDLNAGRAPTVLRYEPTGGEAA